MQEQARQRWDIFCRVVDNYGDIGVCWRLARQLADEYPFDVRLWVDDLNALITIWPSAQHCTQQWLERVEVCEWRDQFPKDTLPADVIIEAFGCDLPASYLSAMKLAKKPPHWFNLEYLSAEKWVEDCHGLLSPHPQLGLKKAFFFPGFTAKTGGLIKESHLSELIKPFAEAPSKRLEFMQSLGIVEPAGLTISLFAYENAAIASLLNAWSQSPRPITCLVPPSKILNSINEVLGKKLSVGDQFTQNKLNLHVIPFLDQLSYDKLLWTCDLNFIRGEDSFVRAQWAGKPFVWHIYPQEDGIHLEKLNAFWERYAAQMPSESKSAVYDLWQAWNLEQNCTDSWKNLESQLNIWRQHSRNWVLELNSLGDLASNMVQFCQKTL